MLWYSNCFTIKSWKRLKTAFLSSFCEMTDICNFVKYREVIFEIWSLSVRDIPLRLKQECCSGLEALGIWGPLRRIIDHFKRKLLSLISGRIVGIDHMYDGGVFYLNAKLVGFPWKALFGSPQSMMVIWSLSKLSNNKKKIIIYTWAKEYLN